MTHEPFAPLRRAERRGPALTSDARAFGLRRRVVTTSTGRIVVRSGEVTGDVATIMLHGAAGSWTTWTPLLRAAQSAGAPLRDVVALDLPAWGESPASTTALDIERMSRTVREVAQSLGYRRWVLIGHSLGGFLALDVAARENTATEGVLLVSPSGPAVIDAIRHPVRGGAALPGFAGMLLTMRVLVAMGPLAGRLVRGLHSLGALRALSAPLFAAPSHVHHTVIDALSHEVRPRAFVDAARAAARYDETIWRAVTCPVRAVYGERDVFARDTDRIGLAELIPDFAAETLSASGHFAAVEQPEHVLSTLRSLTARHRPHPSWDAEVTPRSGPAPARPRI